MYDFVVFKPCFKLTSFSIDTILLPTFMSGFVLYCVLKAYYYLLE